MLVTMDEENAIGVALAKVGAQEFEELVLPHVVVMGRLAARLASPEHADDIVQDALLRAWKSRTSYDPRRGSLLNWLLAITANEARRGSRIPRWLPFLRPASAAVPIEESLDLQQALKTLSHRQRMAVDCRYYVGLSIAETATLMGCSEGTVKSTLSDARERLRRQLEVRR
jgi:RNA polymerase sigma-70 factor (ECF subfamily)